jgi:hypothetical protein
VQICKSDIYFKSKINTIFYKFIKKNYNFIKKIIFEKEKKNIIINKAKKLKSMRMEWHEKSNDRKEWPTLQ